MNHLRRGLLWILLLIVATIAGTAAGSKNQTILERDGWNLISVCADMNRSEIDMSGIEEIQSQNGLTIYTGEYAELSNLKTLHAGYGYWVKGKSGISFNSGESRTKLVQPLTRDGWNLMASCEDIPKSEIDMSGIEEIQAQNGHTLYTGEYAGSSNLDNLRRGYGYWVKGSEGTPFTSQRGLSIPSGFDYQTINNTGATVEGNYEGYLVKVFANYSETANDQVNHTALNITINGTAIPVLQIQGTYRNHDIVVAVYDTSGKLIAVSDNVLIGSSASVTSIALTTDVLSGDAKVSITGKVTYDRVHPKADYNGLDYNNVTKENARQVVVELINANGEVVATTTTDDNGEYLFANLSQNINLKVRVYAKMFKSGDSGWDVKVIDNTNSDAMYVMEGTMLSTGTTNSIRNLNASSTTRTAAPFAVLDNIYDGMKNVLSANEWIAFPALVANWSVNNKASSGDVTNGDIGTSYYSDGKLFILGDANGDTDEYDDHVIAHEWGHYYEDKFSRSDSIGGSHGSGDNLDIRVAFGEGFGNAMSAISLSNPIYFDTYGTDASSGWYMNIESSSRNNPGWFSESSIQRILYDLYDSDDDGSDTLSLGFKGLHNVFVNAEKNTEAFTSIFSFITALKAENPDDMTAIDDIVSSESIATITDIYGTGRTNLANETPLYNSINVGEKLNVCTKNSYGAYNKLNNRKYVKFSLSIGSTYTIRVKQNNGSNSDPDFSVYKAKPHQYMGAGDGENAGVEEKNFSLTGGDYLLDISDYTNQESACFDVSINLAS